MVEVKLLLLLWTVRKNSAWHPKSNNESQRWSRLADSHRPMIRKTGITKIQMRQWWALSVQMWYSSWGQKAAQGCSDTQPGAEPRGSPRAGWVEDGPSRDFWGGHDADPRWSQPVAAHSHTWQNKALALRAVEVWLGVGTCSWFHPLKEVDILSKVPRTWLKVLILLVLLIPVLHTLFTPLIASVLPFQRCSKRQEQEAQSCQDVTMKNMLRDKSRLPLHLSWAQVGKTEYLDAQKYQNVHTCDSRGTPKEWGPVHGVSWSLEEL